MALERGITGLLHAWSEGEAGAREALIEAIYPEMKRVALRALAREPKDLSLQATEIVHETYLALSRQRRVAWQDRRHFLSVSGHIIRRILVDHARAKGREKRGKGVVKVGLVDCERELADPVHPDLLELHEALLTLERQEPSAARLVELRYFAGLTIDEAADELGIGRTTAVRLWQFARARLHRNLQPASGPR